jgi:endo-1,4-beta-xylanase
MLRGVLAFAGLAIAGLCALAPASAKAAILTSGPQSPPYGGYVCADVINNSQTPGTLIQAYSCHGGSNQDFELIGTTIFALSGTRCMDVEGNGNNGAVGTPVDSYTCTGGANQKWYYSYGRIISLQTGLCLDATASTSGTHLVVNRCNGANSQQWQLK